MGATLLALLTFVVTVALTTLVATLFGYQMVQGLLLGAILGGTPFAGKGLIFDAQFLEGV